MTKPDSEKKPVKRAKAKKKEEELLVENEGEGSLGEPDEAPSDTDPTTDLVEDVSENAEATESESVLTLAYDVPAGSIQPAPNQPATNNDSKQPSNLFNRLPNNQKAMVGGIAAVAIIGLLLLGWSNCVFGHSFTQATCTEYSYCRRCGEIGEQSLGHTHGEEWTVVEAPTCTKTGLEEIACDRCGEILTQEIPATGHSFGDWIIDQEATCSEVGKKHRECSDCVAIETEEIPKAAHTYGEWIVDVEPTCSEEGSEHRECSVCGHTESLKLSKAEHTPGEWTVTKEFTVSSRGNVTPGTESLQCSVCGAVIDTRPYSIELTRSQENALGSAASYLSFMPFSHDGLVKQLEYEGYSHEDAVFAADHCGADWYRQAELSAESYLDFMNFSHSGLVNQLMYEGFTQDQAEHGVTAAGL